MITSENPWDILGKSNFNVHIRKGEIDPSAADNILIAWPPILEILNKTFSKSQGIKVLDYGCGTGGLCIKLDSMGFDVTGIDTSTEMINAAKHHSPSSIKYFVGNEESIPPESKFEAITTVKTTPYIKDLDKVLQTLVTYLKKDGLLFVVDFNREWVKESLKHQIWFANFDSTEFPQEGLKTFGDIGTPVFIRDKNNYNNLAKLSNLKNILEVSPTFTSEFVRKYPEYKPVNISEYLILGYKKF